MLLIFASTGNSYERLQPSANSGAYQCIGNEQKEAASCLTTLGGVLERFELKSPDGTASSYLLLASLIGAGIHGIQHKLVVPAQDKNNASYESEKP
jgi:glutamine synthetase